jgi:YegS/Rv2252/BmrU family lipid kinase
LTARRFLFIVNPAAGKGKQLDKLEKVKSEFSIRSVPFDLYFTTKDQKADILTSNLIKDNNYTDILILGGDGTINEVINGLGGQRIPISVVSIGSGNDSIKHIQSGYNFRSQLHTAFNGRIKEVDAGVCNERLFLNGVGIGFDGKVVERMVSKGKRFQGHLAYMAEVLKILLSYQEKSISAVFNGSEINKEILLMTVAKGTTFGGGFMINPFAVNDDGMLDICVIGRIPRWIRISYVLKMKNGGHRNLKPVSFYKSKEVYIRENPLIVAHMDGEFIGHPPFDIKVHPETFQFRI